MRTWIAWLALTTFAAGAQDVAARLEAVSAGYAKHRNFMGSVLVAKGGRILLDKAYGMANLEWDVANTPATKFRLGSITKQFTAVAILQLQERGKLSVTDAACRYVDNCPDAWKAVTIHQLLTHTSGIPSYTSQKDFTTPKGMRLPLSPLEVTMLTRDQPMDFAPGTQYRYNNTGYVMLGVIIEKVSGEKYANYVQKHIFDPLGMTGSGYDTTESVLKGRAAGYVPGPNGLRNADFLDMTLPHAAGSLYSTTGDLYKWDRALYGDQVLKARSRQVMAKAEKNDYAYGWQVAPFRGRKHLYHAGDINGFTTVIQRFPDDDAVVIVLSNQERGRSYALARALAATIFGETVELPWEVTFLSLDAAALERFVGVYDIKPYPVTVTVKDGRLLVEQRGREKLEAKPVAANRFLLIPSDESMSFNGETLTIDRSVFRFSGKRTK